MRNLGALSAAVNAVSRGCRKAVFANGAVIRPFGAFVSASRCASVGAYAPETVAVRLRFEAENNRFRHETPRLNRSDTGEPPQSALRFAFRVCGGAVLNRPPFSVSMGGSQPHAVNRPGNGSVTAFQAVKRCANRPENRPEAETAKRETQAPKRAKTARFDRFNRAVKTAPVNRPENRPEAETAKREAQAPKRAKTARFDRFNRAVKTAPVNRTETARNRGNGGVS